MPEIGEIRYGRDIGYKCQSMRYIWHACENCKKERWVCLIRGQLEATKCNSCSKIIPTEPIEDSPKIGEIRFDREIGRKNRSNRFIWQACVGCGKERWVAYKKGKAADILCLGCVHLGGKLSHATRLPTLLEIGQIKIGGELGFKYVKQKYIGELCPNCGNSRWVQVGDAGKRQKCVKCKLAGRYGEQSGSWRGGRRISRSGYIEIKLTPNSPYWEMATKNGYVKEHRLVMAQYLGRNLKGWEEVHHRGIRHPLFTKENKSDNRLNNLLLVTLEHNTMGEKQLINLTKQVQGLQTIVVIVLARLTVLEAENIALKYSETIIGDM
jgi:hypothetical protein